MNSAHNVGTRILAAAACLALAAIFAVGAAPAGPARAASVCSEVLGFSQTGEWYPSFEQEAGDDSWQVTWRGGGGVDKWRDPAYFTETRSRNLRSHCASGSDAPDAVLLTISGPYGSDVAAWVLAIQATIVNIRTYLPSAITLQAVVGGPDEATCEVVDASGNLRRVRASFQHTYIDQAIAQAIAADQSLSTVHSPEVRSCDDYEDSLGHLAAAAEEPIGQNIAAAYAGSGSEPPPDPCG